MERAATAVLKVLAVTIILVSVATAQQRYEFGSSSAKVSPKAVSTKTVPSVPLFRLQSTAQQRRIPIFFPKKVSKSEELRELERLSSQPPVPGEQAVRATGVRLQTVQTQNSFQGFGPTGWMPPDGALAVGDNQVVEAVNASFAVYSKSGTLLYSTSLQNWFSNVNVSQYITDPRAYYDRYDNRFVILASAIDYSQHTCYYVISVSQTSSAIGSWWNYKLDATLNGSNPTANWADYPSLGYDNSFVYVTSNQFTFADTTFQYAKLRMIDKNVLYAGGSIGWTDWWNMKYADGSTVFTLKPAKGATGTEYFLSDQSYQGSDVTLWSIISSSSPDVLTLNNTFNIGSYSLPPRAAQYGGGNLLNTGDCRVQDVVFNNGLLSFGFTQSYNWGDGNVDALRLLQINTSTNAVTQNIIYGHDGVNYFYPAVACDTAGNVFVVYNTSNPNQYCDIRASSEVSTNPASIEIEPGGGYYSGNRWGDYNSASVDPNGTDVWVEAEYPLSSGNWGTWIASLASSTTEQNYAISGQVKDANGNPISAIVMALSGSQSATTKTDISGNYSIANLPSGGNYTVTPSKTNYAFSPPSSTFNNLSQNQVANFTGTLSGNSVAFSVPTNLQGGPGTTVSVPLIINPKGNDVGSFGLRLSFNNSILTYAGSYSQGSIVPSGWNVNVNDSSSKGWVQIGALQFSGNTGITSSGTVLNLSFNVNTSASVGSTDSLIANDQYYLSASDTGANSLPVTATNGFFTVSQLTAQISGQLYYFSGNKALSGDTASLFTNNSPTPSVQISSADGSFSFTSVPLGSSDSLLAARISGNYPASTTITPTDALLAFQGRDGGPKTLTGYQELAADVTGDGKVNPTDALAILKRAIGSFSSFSKYGVADWIFIGSSFPINSGNWYSAPTYREYSRLSGNQSSQNFVGIIRGDVTGSYGTSSPSALIASASAAGKDGITIPLSAMAEDNFPNKKISTGAKSEISSDSTVIFNVPNNLYSATGDTVRIPLDVDPKGNSVAAFGVTLEFNSQILTYDTLENGDTDPLADSWAIDANGNNSAGSVNVGAFNMASPTKSLRGNGAVAYLVFSVANSAHPGDTTGLALTDLSASDTGAVPLPVTGINGKLTVSAGQPIKLSLPTLNGVAGDTVIVPLVVDFPSNSSYSSLQLMIGGFQGKIIFAGIVPDSGMIGKAGWIYQTNSNDTLVLTASAGANDISGSGSLMLMRFFIPLNADTGFVPIVMDTAFFNTGTTPVTLSSGGIHIQQSILYGDVDMNGKVQAYDAALILKYLVGQITLDNTQLVRARVSFDTTVSTLDASYVLKYVVGLIDTLPYNPDDTSNATGLITMDSITVTPGEIVQVPLYLTQGKNILSFEGQIAYDSTNLQLQGVTWSSVNDNLMVYSSDTAGVIKFAGARTEPDSGNGVFADLAFRLNPRASGPTTIVLSGLRWNEGALMKNVAKAVLVVTGVDEAGNEIPKEFRLSQNYPNPFNPTTVISYDLPKRSHVLITVYDVLGREVKTLVNGNQPAGRYQVTFDGSNLPSGVYFYKITAGNFVKTMKFVLIK